VIRKEDALIIPPQVVADSRLYQACCEVVGQGAQVVVLPEGGVYFPMPSENFALPEGMKVAAPKANKSKTNLAGDRCTPDLYEARAAFVRAEAGRLSNVGGSVSIMGPVAS
jgi:hypothetical protein